MKILLAADGSEHSGKAARDLARFVVQFRDTPEIHVLYVHPAMPFRGAAAAVGKAAVEKYQKEDSLEALAVAEKELSSQGIAFESHWCAGDVVEQLNRFVVERGIQLVVMGSRGHGAFANLAMGSTAMKAIATLNVPVMIVR